MCMCVYIYVYINSLYRNSLSMLIAWCQDPVPSRRSISGKSHHYSPANSEQGFL